MNRTRDEFDQINIPLTSAEGGSENLDDLDATGVIGSSSHQNLRRHHSQADAGSVWDSVSSSFATFWRQVPTTWHIERDPHVALRHVLTLFSFVSLCVFIFSIPSLLYVISPRAPTPPGTAPDLDEAASMISGKNGAVAADHPVCSELGVKVLKDLNGNAVDAMVSTVLCQGVLSPFASGIGGGAFILIHHTYSGVSTFYDARETAPAAANMAMYSSSATTAKFGGKAIAVPGELRGLYAAHKDFGVLNWTDVVKPAIEVAKEAKVGKFLALKLQQMNTTIFASPSLKSIFTKKVLTKKGQVQQNAEASVELPGIRRNVASINGSTATVRGVVESFKDDSVVTDASDKDNHGAPKGKIAEANSNETHAEVLLEEGDKLLNEKLISTLTDIGEKGPDAFYIDLSGAVAKEVQDAGGIVTKHDIMSYSPVIREVVRSAYHGFEVLGAPVPSSSGTSIAMALNMISELQFRKKGRNSISYHLLVETMKWVFGARMGLGDPDFVRSAGRQMRRMLTRREALTRVFRINQDHTYRPRHYSPRISTSSMEHGTSHVSILDKNGTAVSVTSTINLPFGAGLVSESSGVILNDQMDAFTTSMTRVNAFGMYPSAENRVQGGKRPMSSMCPTIILRNGRVYLVVGGSGGPKATTGVLQTLLNILDFGDSLSDAISAPRIHHQLVPNVISIEGANGTTCEQSHAFLRPSDVSGKSGGNSWAYWKSVCSGLKDVGHEIAGPGIHGAVQAILVPDALGESIAGTLFAASDPRRIGKAAAY